jgi:anaerobic dimethyl sulfoxide reductase subunit A
MMESVREKILTRRRFVQGSAFAAAVLALHGCVGPGNSLQETKSTDAMVDGEWVPTVCWAHCGGKCFLKAYIVDGIVVRLKTDDTHEDSVDWPLVKACARGRSRRMDVFGPTRLKYPMKRKNWQPGGGENSSGQLRGIDEWERISWDEALDTIATEIIRIRDAYGNNAILGSQSGTPGWKEGDKGPDEAIYVGRHFEGVLSMIGGCFNQWTTASSGAWSFAGQQYGYQSYFWQNDRYEARKCDYIIAIGMNPAVTSDGQVMFSTIYPIMETGTKFYFVDPMYNDTCAGVGGEWVPIRPATDKALLLAMAYVLLSEDNPTNNPMVDWEFLEKCCIGYDAEHMPEGTNPEHNFKDYALGTYDGMPKTPEWASEICGVPAEKIWELGRLMGMKNKVGLVTGFGPARNQNAEIMTQLHMIVGALGGHIGQSGHMTGVAMDGVALNENRRLIRPGGWPLPKINNPVDDCVNTAGMWKGGIEGKYWFTGSDGGKRGEEREMNIKCYYSFYRNSMMHSENMAQGVDFLRTLDLVVVHEIHLSDDAKYADFVLPCITPWEKVPIFTMTGTNRCSEWAMLQMPITDPIYETKDDQWIGAELLKRWGEDPAVVYPMDEMAQHHARLFGATVMKDDGEYEPLVSFTEEEAALFGPYAEARAEGRISYTEFSQIGMYRIQRHEGDAFEYIGGKSFRDDPQGNPVGSESGKLEFYSKTAERISTDMGISVIPPIPRYVATLNGYESTFSDYGSKVKGEYPYQIYSPHYPRSNHAHFDYVGWLREAFARPVFISSQDANEKGIDDGDTVRIYNANGSVLRQACVTERIMPGVIGLPHGGESEVDPVTGYNLGGTNSWLGYPSSTGRSVCAYNSQIGNIEKYTGMALIPDMSRANRTPACQLV